MEPSPRIEILREVQQMMKELFQLDAARVEPAARLIDDLELDSLDAMDLAVKLEETTGLVLDEAKLRELRTVDDVITAVEALLGGRPLASFRAAPAAQVGR